jgi:hypothetical protein
VDVELQRPHEVQVIPEEERIPSATLGVERERDRLVDRSDVRR